MRVRDWSSDVCSSDLKPTDPHPDGPGCPFPAASCIMETGRGERAMADSGWGKDIHAGEVGEEFDRGTGRLVHVLLLGLVAFRSVERRLGKDRCRSLCSRWSASPNKTKEKKVTE